jgi:hypothetical protein
MNPLLMKFLIVFVLSIIFLIVIITFVLFYKNYVRPLFVRIFFYKKILKTAEVILKAEADKDKKVTDLVKNNLVDTDLIRIAEEHIVKARIKAEKDKLMKAKKPFDWKRLKFWRKDKHGEEKSVQQDSGSSNKGDAGAKETSRGSEVAGAVAIAETGAGAGGVAEGSDLSAVSSRHEGFGVVSGESVETSRRRGKYFN